MPIKIRFIKDCDCGKIGEIKNYSNNSAHSLVEEGYAEYLEEQQNKPKKVIPKQLINCNFNRVRFKEKKAFEIEWQNKPYSYDGIQKYFPKENYGVICGSDLRVLDDDTSDKKLIKLFINEFGKTFRVRDHLYFKFDNGYSKKMILFGENKNHLGEVQGENTYVVGAGSTHPSGELYELKEDLPIIEISYDKFIEVFKNYIPSNDFNVKEADIEQGDEEIINELLPKWNEGNRQNLTLNLAGYLRKNKGFGFKHTQQIIQEICRRTGDLDLTERLNAVKETYFKDEEEIKGVSGLKEQEIILETESFLIPKFDKKGEFLNYVVNIDKVAEFLIKKFEFNTIYGTKSDYCFAYDGRIHKPNARGIIKAESERLLNTYCKRNVVEEIFEKIKRLTKIERAEFERTDEDLIPLENGVWKFSEKKLIPHNSKYNFKFIIPVEYNPNATCPTWLKFLGEALYPEDIPVAQEWFGFNLYREYFIKKALICKGQKDTGKSVFLDTLICFVGEQNKTGISLQKISSGSDFTKLSLKDKQANIYDDLSSADLNDGGSFKVATGGGYISGEEKFGDYIQFKSYAKQTFATNKIPPVKDNDDLAYFSRWIIFSFDSIPEKMDNFLRKKLSTRNEMSGILNWALEGLYRLMENGKFSYSKTPEEIKQIMELSGCPLVAFGLEVLEKANGEVISKDEMYQVYSAWCEKSKKPRLSKEMLGRQLDKYVSYIVPQGGSKRIWQNVKFKENWENFKENHQKNLENDTSYTSQKNMRTYFKIDKNDKNSNQDMVDMCFLKVSEESQDKSTNDTFLEKENGSLELNFEESGI